MIDSDLGSYHMSLPLMLQQKKAGSDSELALLSGAKGPGKLQVLIPGRLIRKLPLQRPSLSPLSRGPHSISLNIASSDG